VLRDRQRQETEKYTEAKDSDIQRDIQTDEKVKADSRDKERKGVRSEKRGRKRVGNHMRLKDFTVLQ
jgi:hypothetical protein